MLLQECHGLPSHIFLVKRWFPSEALHLLLQQEEVITLLRAIAKLIEEVVDFVFASVVHIDVKPDERSLHIWHDVFELSRVLLDHVLVQCVVRVHELCHLFVVFAELGEVLLVQVVEQLHNGFLGLLHLFNFIEVTIVLLSSDQAIFTPERRQTRECSNVGIESRSQVLRQVFKQDNKLARVHV